MIPTFKLNETQHGSPYEIGISVILNVPTNNKYVYVCFRCEQTQADYELFLQAFESKSFIKCQWCYPLRKFFASKFQIHFSYKI